MLEKELNFYDFDEELLQFRPIEIDRLVQSLLNLKSALILTSSDHEVENIIDYSNCEYIFHNFLIGVFATSVSQTTLSLYRY